MNSHQLLNQIVNSFTDVHRIILSTRLNITCICIYIDFKSFLKAIIFNIIYFLITRTFLFYKNYYKSYKSLLLFIYVYIIWIELK